MLYQYFDSVGNLIGEDDRPDSFEPLSELAIGTSIHSLAVLAKVDFTQCECILTMPYSDWDGEIKFSYITYKWEGNKLKKY
jgi:putative Mn2+ efflux pump MntP